MAFDSARGVSVLFGGEKKGGDFSEETWEWDGTNWTQATPSVSPPGLVGAGLAYDSAREVIVLFGGGIVDQNMNETWEWDGTDWTQRMPATVPPARSIFAMTYDAARAVTVIFGGSNSGTVWLGDTWIWDGTNWAQESSAQNPSTRTSDQLVNGPGCSVSVLFGGGPGPNGAIGLNDTWVWSASGWTQVMPDPAPSARYGHSMVYDAGRHVAVLFGGMNAQGYLNDTWELSGP